jgi:outer membrane protein
MAMKTWMTVTTAVLLLLLDGSLASAQAPIRLSLEDAIARGIQTNPRLSGLDARKVAAEAAVRVQDVADRPLISLQAGYTRTSHVPETIIPTPDRFISLYPDIPDNARTRIDLRWPIYTGGRTDALARAERAEADALGHDRAAAEADLTFEITRAYWAVVTARATVGVLDEALLRMDAHLRDARNRLQIGLVPRTDVLSSEAQRSREQMLLIEARNIEGSALADFRRLVGLPPDAAVELDPGPARPPTRPAVAPLLDEARTARPDRRALEARITRAGQLRAARRLAASRRCPSTEGTTTRGPTS